MYINKCNACRASTLSLARAACHEKISCLAEAAYHQTRSSLLAQKEESERVI
jgi:hypothetical protein